jgi:hypothetical protein
MVEVNATLFVQIAHFLIVYALLRFFLWKPIIKQLQDEEQHKATLGAELKKQQYIVEQKKFDLVKMKDEAAQAYATGMPTFVPAADLAHRAAMRPFELHMAKLSSEQIDRAVEQIVQKVEE